MVSTLLLLSCGGLFDGGDSQDVETAAGQTPTEMASIDLLTRVSMDLRGVRPNLEEIERLAQDPEALDTIIEEFLHDERFGEQLRNHYANIYLTRLDYYYVQAEDYGLYDEPGFASAVGEEPLRILSTIAEEDLPYTEIVLGDWTMANEVLAQAWEMDYPQDESGWQKAHYTDTRPAAGLLATNSFWWRYMSNTSNANRGRANAVSRVLLCVDYLTKPIEFDRTVNLLDEDAVKNALQNNPGCAACHYSLDPIASYLWGFFYYDYDSKEDISIYHPEREFLWETYSGVSPGYFGEAGWGLQDLSQQLAADPGLIECAVEQAYGIFLGRDVALEDTNALTQHREVFLGNGLTLRSLYRSILSDPNYRSEPGEDPGGAALKFVSTDQMASQIEDITGYRFMFYGYDMMSTDTYGLRTLAGGVDGYYVTSPARNPTATMLLVQERLAQAAAWYVVDQDKGSEEPILFKDITFYEMPGTGQEKMVEQLQHLHLRLFGNHVEADGPEIEANLELWQELFEADASTADAWAGVLSVLLRDPDFLVY